jgi:hypothetical protein
MRNNVESEEKLPKGQIQSTGNFGFAFQHIARYHTIFVSTNNLAPFRYILRFPVTDSFPFGLSAA